MIAQPIVTTASAAKTQATQQLQQQPTANGFLSLLSTTDSALTDLAQNTGATAVNAATTAATNANKSAKDAEQSATPYIAAPTTLAANEAKQASVNANGSAANAVTPANASAATNGQDAAGQNANGNSTGFGADELNARVAAGAPIYASQPTAAMATVPAHLLDPASIHPQAPAPAEPAKPGNDAASKPAADTTTPANASDAPNAVPSLPATHAAASDQSNTGASANDNTAPASTSTDASAATASDGSSGTAASASLVTQPNTAPSVPAQVDAAIHTAAPYVPVGEQVALNLKQALTADNNEIRIQLKPASLGTIDVKLNLTQDGRVSAVISADRSDTLNILKQDSGSLQQALRDAGLNADSSSLSFNLRGDAQSFAQNWSQGGGGNSNGGGYAGASNAAPVAAGPIATNQSYHAGALDIEV